MLEHIEKVGSKWRLVSKKTGKSLGTYSSKAGAEKRERQVQYFKHAGEALNATEALDMLRTLIDKLHQRKDEHAS